MRFVLAIVAFVAAACMIALGIAQRTVFLEPASVSVGTTVEGNGPFTVIDSDALLAHEGAQTVSIRGSGDTFMSYGRTADIEAWLGDIDFTRVSYDEDAKELATTVVRGQTVNPMDQARVPEVNSNGLPATAPNPNPRGSDLWLEEWSGENSISATVNVPEGISVLVATDGTAPAPKNIRLSWPLDNSTPWAGPLIAGGALLLLVGLVLYLLALLHLRRSRGPRRNLPKGPRMPKLPRAPKPKMIKAIQITGAQRKSIGRSSRIAVLPVLLISGLALSGCSASFWPDMSAPSTTAATPTPDVTAAQEEFDELPPPAVTVPQLERIVRNVAVTANEADSTMNAELLPARFTGPALLERQMNYQIRAGFPEQALPAPIPASPLEIILPQQNSSWPRTVLTVILNEEDPTIAPMTLVLTQNSPRENYQVEYAITLAADAVFPEVAPASIGAPPVAPDTKFLVMEPDKLAAAYGDVILKDTESEYYPLFDIEHDSFVPQVGVAATAERRAALPATTDLTLTNEPGPGNTVALGTIDSGAVVAVNLYQMESATPNDNGTVEFKASPTKSLSGVEKTTKGLTSTRSDQLLFYVPAQGSDEKIRLLGFAHSLIAASEIP
ncbi:hypothetical protein [Microterricola pindariensis]|uniref:DUF8094 domain-containing protein n=1 Tax=Microterricola pindariensis TaxID=478010 RepID=A0ABX5AS42_9MICO|nr:hypothetical protein [Microterricola pindariensis]PPL14477.1 hypothetical protein GY24_16230 [Microterricola pindariensis]